MSDEKKWKKLPAKQMSAERLQQWFSHTAEDEKKLLTLIAMELRNFAMEQIIWARNEDASGLGLFDSSDPYEGACILVEKLRIFGYLPNVKEPQ